MELALVNGRVLTPKGLAEGFAVVIEDGRIARVASERGLSKRLQRRDLEGGVLAPGFIDVQVNGGGGVLFSDEPSVEAIAAIGAAHRGFGTTAFLPTLISSDFDVIARAIGAVRRAIAEGVPGVLGIHIEGPFLSAKRKGVHDAGFFRKLDERAFKLVASLGNGHGKTLVTLAPEATSPAMIRRLSRAGVVVAAGHTDATYEIVREALAAGLTGFTHIFNAMSPLTARAPGAVGAALEDQESWCGMIVDGHHVDPAVLRIALRCKPRSKFMLVTDAMPSVGTTRKSFQLQGRTIKVKNGVCVDPDGTLAGANLDMASALRNSVKFLKVSLEEAAAMASRNPAQFLGVADIGVIAAGARADLVLLDDALQVKEIWIAGIAASEAPQASAPRLRKSRERGAAKHTRA